MSDAKRDANMVPTLLGVSSSDGITPVPVYVDPITHRVLVSSASNAYTIETPTGTVDGSNQSFTVTNTPVYIISDGATYFENAGYTIVGLTITLTVPPQSFIRSFS